MRCIFRLMAVVTCALACLQGGPASAEKRLALSVGIDAYDNLPADAQLKKAVNDARAVGSTFRDLGFEVTVEENVSKLAFSRAWTRFLNRLQPGDTAALFFAGHGAEIGGLNYLWPRDVPKVVLGEERVLSAATIRFNELMDDLRDRKVRVALFIIDACRDNPFRDSRGRSVGRSRGLVPVEPAKGLFVMYSAGAGEIALDDLAGTDKDANSPYTRTLLPLLKTPGLSLQEIARRVRSQVAVLALPHEQTPAYYDNLLGDFLLKPGAAPEQPQLSETERAWAAVKDTTNIPALEAFRQHHGKDNPVYYRLAEERIEELKWQVISPATLPPNVGEPSDVTPIPPRPKVAIKSVVGPPSSLGKQLQQELATALHRQQIVVAAGQAEHIDVYLRPYFLAAIEKNNVKLSYVLDVLDPTGKRLNRFAGEEIVPARPLNDPWAAITPTVAQSIAQKGIGSFVAWLPRLLVVVPAVIGAPGDGKISLTAAIRRELRIKDIGLADRPAANTYQVQGVVTLGRADIGKQPIQVEWVVKDPQGKKLGTVSQKNDIPEGSLDDRWGDTADQTARAAVKGILLLLQSKH